MFWVLDDVLLGCQVALSRFTAACMRRGVSCSIVCPLSVSLCINFSRMGWKFEGLFWIQYLLTSPWISPLKQLCGCAERGGGCTDKDSLISGRSLSLL